MAENVFGPRVNLSTAGQETLPLPPSKEVQIHHRPPHSVEVNLYQTVTVNHLGKKTWLLVITFPIYISFYRAT